MPEALAPSYPFTQADKIKLVNRLADWHVKLGLGDWHCLSVELKDDYPHIAECFSFPDQQAYRVVVRSHWDIPVCDQNIDYICCHELLHVVLAQLWKIAYEHCPPALNDTLNRVEHIAIARLCNALAHPTKVVRGIENIEEVPEAARTMRLGPGPL